MLDHLDHPSQHLKPFGSCLMDMCVYKEHIHTRYAPAAMLKLTIALVMSSVG